MSVSISHLAIVPGPLTETGVRTFRVEALARDDHTGAVLVDRRGADAMVWPDCLTILPPALVQPFTSAVIRHFVSAIAGDARTGHYQVVGRSPRDQAAAPDTSPFTTALTPDERHRLYQLLVRVDNALADAGAAFFLTGGGLLGAVRYGELLPWDDDLDILVVGGADAADLAARLPDLAVEGAAGGTVVVRHPLGFPKIDLVHAGAKDGDQLRKVYGGLRPDSFTPLGICLPPSRGKLGPVETNLPADPAAFARFAFGPHCLESAVPPEKSNRDGTPTGRPRLRVPLKDLYTPPPPPPAYEWLTTAKLLADTTVLAGRLPSDITAVVGLPRSGMLPATALATQLHLPLWELTDGGELNRLGHGGRGRNFADEDGRFLVVDDVVYDGNAITRARAAMRKLNCRAVFAAPYVRARSQHVVDHFVRFVEEPQLAEWNIFNNGYMVGRGGWSELGDGVGCDFDGIICHDEHSGGDPGTPYLLPRSHGCPMIVTGRPESERANTLAWLAQWGVECPDLRMLPPGAPFGNERAARHKAHHYRSSRLGLYVESCPYQAALIHRWSGKPVLCPRIARVFAKTRPGRDRLANLEYTPRCDHDQFDYPLDCDLNRVAGLLELLAHVGPVRRMVEVGCYRGVSSETFAIHTHELVCVDNWNSSFYATGEMDFITMAADYPNLRTLRADSLEAARAVPDGSLDLLYLDAGHTAREVAADLAAWVPKVRAGGFVAGHDYTPNVDEGGVIAAVNDRFSGPDRVFSDTSWVVQKR